MSVALQRSIGLPGAMLLGLGSIVGTGVFVSLAIGTAATGSSVLMALGAAGILAALNGASSAQLAAAFPVSGGTYEYANRTLGGTPGFIAGWMFLCAKSASAATAALGTAGYVCDFAGLAGWVRTPLAFTTTLLITALVRGGIRRSNTLNTVLVGTTFAVLAWLVVVGLPECDPSNWQPVLEHGPVGFLEACALMFVAFTGYGRIATLGEEVHEPRRTIPIAIAATLAAVVVLYTTVCAVAIGVLGADGFMAALDDTGGAPLFTVAGALGPWTRMWVGLAALTAMLGVLLNLVLGLSRVQLAMARRGDMPRAFATVDAAGTSPTNAVVGMGAFVALLTLTGDVSTTWSFSAFTVLVYYAMTNASALALPEGDRFLPRVASLGGLLGCLGLAVWVDRYAWMAGLAVLGLGLGLRHFAHRGTE